MSYLAEKEVIGSLLMNQDCMSKIYKILEPDMFTNEILGKVYHEYQKAYDRGYALTMPMLEQKLRSEELPSDLFMDELRTCMMETTSSAYVERNAMVVESDYKAQKLNLILNSIKVTPKDLKSQIGALQCELEALQNNTQTNSKTLSEIVAENKDKYFREKEVKPLHIGFSKLDEILGGLEGGDMIVIGARPAVGKSAFVTQITSNLEKQGKKIGFYNLEMSDKQMYERFVVNESGIGLTRLRRAIRFLGDEEERFNKANEKLLNSENIIITSDGTKKVSEIYAESKHMDYDIIIIDYLQLLEPEGTYKGNRAAEVGEISRHIKQVAKNLNIPIIALSQLNRTSMARDDKEPTMSELREAGNIEQDASVIMLLWNLDENDRTKKGCKIEKNRQGECGKIAMRFNGDTMQFEEMSETVKEASEWKKMDSDNPFV